MTNLIIIKRSIAIGYVQLKNHTVYNVLGKQLTPGTLYNFKQFKKKYSALIILKFIMLPPNIFLCIFSFSNCTEFFIIIK